MQDMISGITRRVADLLAGPLGACGVRVTPQFPAQARPRPLRDCLVAVGMESAELASRAMADYWGSDSGGVLSGTMLELTLSLLICAPPDAAGERCQQIFGTLCDALLFSCGDLDVTRVWCETLRSDREVEALTLPCFARLRIPVCRTASSGGAPLEEVLVRRRESAAERSALAWKPMKQDRLLEMYEAKE